MFASQIKCVLRFTARFRRATYRAGCALRGAGLQKAAASAREFIGSEFQKLKCYIFTSSGLLPLFAFISSFSGFSWSQHSFQRALRYHGCWHGAVSQGQPLLICPKVPPVRCKGTLLEPGGVSGHAVCLPFGDVRLYRGLPAQTVHTTHIDNLQDFQTLMYHM